MRNDGTPARDVVTVGIDGSGGDRAAIVWALRAAEAYGLPVRLVHAHPHAYDSAVIDRVRAAETIARTVSPDAMIRTVAVTGRATGVLVEESAKARMVVLAPHAGAPLDGFCWSTTTMVAASADCPVVALPRSSRSRPENGPVVVGVDGPAVSDAAVAFAFEHAAVVGAELTAVHSWQDEPGETVSREGIGREPVPEAGQRLLDVRLARWQERYPQVVVHRVVAHGRPARALITAAETAQLLVVGFSGPGGLSGLLHGSTNQALLYELPCPLAIVGGAGR